MVPVKKATARKRKVNKKVESEDDDDGTYVGPKKSGSRKRKVNKKVDSEDDEDSTYVGPKKSDSRKRANIIPMDRRQRPPQWRCSPLASPTTTFRKCVLYHS
ncbi:hypothetical protein CEP51_006849 [Fusarium floridanum]|uniref:Uncharacterized protein n=1 Tax=Fusarium floridanum TaxID=1325733 RepID=A0A428RR91_9HYPO|nr:hypothetical protein CEP51_006849 [Fusarium floridanum]